MDKTTIGEVEFAQLLFSGLKGLSPSAQTQDRARSYWQQNFTSPWADASEPNAAQYTQRFMQALKEISQTSNLIQRWQPHFDQYNRPIDSAGNSFISDCMRVLLHHPRSYHEFTCQRQTVSSGHVMDFPIIHPLSVDHWSVYISHRGEGVLEWHDESFAICPQQVLVMPPARQGRVVRALHSEEWQFDLLIFRSSPPWIELLDWSLSQNQPVLLDFTGDRHWPYMVSSIEQLETTAYRAAHQSEKLCFNLIENLLIRFSIKNEQMSGDDRQFDKRLHKLVNFLLLNYKEPLELAEIVEHVHLSPSHLNTLFREQFGESVIKWRDNLRLQKSKELLLSTNLSVNEVASKVGYSDPLYFSRRFRKQFNCSPRQFRQSQD